MSIFNESFKTVIGTFGVTTLIISGLVNDVRFNSTDFMNREAEVVMSRLDADSVRTVASQNKSIFEINLDLHVNAQNKSLINGEWELVKVENYKGETIEEFAQEEIQIEYLELVRTGIVSRAVEGELYEYIFSSIENGKIRIVEMNEVETEAHVLVLHKVKSRDEVIASQVEEEVLEEASEEVQRDEKTYYVNNAFNAIQTNKKYKVFGDSISFYDNRLEGLVTISENGDEKVISLSGVELSSDNKFQFDYDGETASGIFIQEGANNAKIYFSTKGLQGVNLLLGVQEAVVETRELDQEQDYAAESRVSDELDNEYVGDDEENTDRFEDEEERDEYVMTKGLNIMANASRSVASQN